MMAISWVMLFSDKASHAIIAVVVACLLPFVCAFLAKLVGGFDFKTDNQNPREFLAKSTGLSARLNASQANSFEGLPMFIGAVVFAMYAFVPQNIVNAVAWLYVLLRVIYVMAYAMNLALFRSVIWVLSLTCCLQLFYLSIKALS